jgi:hypothetical protein
MRLSVCVALVLLTGCVAALPYRNQLGYDSLAQCRTLGNRDMGPIRLEWRPSTFYARMNYQGADSAMGNSFRTRIPTGPSLVSRITEALDTAVGLDSHSRQVLKVNVVEAYSRYPYSQGPYDSTPATEWGECGLWARFTFGKLEWQARFRARTPSDQVGSLSSLEVMERAWDDLALQVTRSVVEHLKTGAAHTS